LAGWAGNDENGELDMTLKFATLAAGIGLAAFAFGVSAQEMGDAQKGQAYARMVCAECHLVEKVQARSPNANAPAFAAVAATPGMTELALRIWFQTPHPTMPNLRLDNDQKDNLIAYILSLKNPAR
jgi:mono/diheme cytochrome c family protein